MNIIFRRHYKLFVVSALLLVVLFSVGPTRIIAYNFGEGMDFQNVSDGLNYGNDVDLFDDSVVHEIEILIEPEDYEIMINTYKETGLKEYFHAGVVIDGVKIGDIGIRLKGQLTLQQALGRGGRFGMGKTFEEEREQEKQAMFGDAVEGEVKQLPFLLKFDEFVTGQTYQGYAEVAVRLNSASDSAMLAEQISYYVHSEVGQIVPQTAYAHVQVDEQGSYLYVITEHIDQKFIDKHFPGSDGVLYKAGNFVGFDYVGDDPTLYADEFEQKTSLNDDDMAPLIRFLKFATESTNEEFENELSDWIDIDSFVRMMALDNLLGNNDSFVGMGSNYYLYYDKNTEQFTMLAWDMNLSMGMMGGGMGGQVNKEFNREAIDQMPVEQGFQGQRQVPFLEGEMDKEEMQRMMERMAERGGFQGGQLPEGQNEEAVFEKENGGVNGGMGRGGTNYLKERFFANETFSAMYEAEYNRLKEIIYDQGLALEKVEKLTQVFTTYNTENNIMEQSEYDAGVANIKSFIERQKDSE